MAKRINKLLFYTLLVSVYGIFFSVESFFNFEGHINAKDIFSYSSITHISGQRENVVKTAPLQSSSSHKVRLNKRFHQEDIALCPIFYVAAPELYVTPRVLGSFRAFVLPAVTVTHYRLRGPPFVA